MPDYTALSRRTGIPVPVLQAIALPGGATPSAWCSTAPARGGSSSRKRHRHRLLW